MRALLVVASNPAVSAPDANRIARRLAALDFLAVSDFFVSETAQLADVVLPTAQWAEEEGTLTNLEGRVLLRRAALPPPDGVRTDLQVFAELARRLGRGQFFTDSPRMVFDELRRASAGGLADYAGITYERIAAERGVFWPCPDIDHPGTPRLFTDRFATADGRARFVAVRHQGPAEQPDRGYPYYLTTGRIMQQYQSGTQTRRVRALLTADPDPAVEIHPTLAAQHEITPGDLVEVSSRRGRAVFRARVSDTIRPDTLFASFHWSGLSTANLLTNPALDPTSRMPEFKACAVTIRRLDGLPDGGSTVPAGATVPVADTTGTTRPPGATSLAPPPLSAPTRKDRRMHSTPRFLQGVFPFEGHGLQKPFLLDPSLTYVVPPGIATQPVYVRAGNSTSELIYLVLLRDGTPMRYFPVGAKGDIHVPLRVVEDLLGDARIEVHVAAPEGTAGTVVVDLGLIEV